MTYDETARRLQTYFSEQDASIIMLGASGLVSWTDGNIIVICTDKISGKYSIVASGYFMELIEP